MPRALASGSGPDVTEGNQGYQTDAQLVKAKLILPLTKYVKKYGWDKLYAPSTWGMFRWTPDGKSFGKGPVWGIAQTGQNVVVFYNKKKLRQAGLDPNKWPTDVRRVRGDAREAAGEAALERPRDRGGQQGGLRLHPPLRRHLGRERQARGRPQLDLPRARLALRHARARSGALTRLQQWAKKGYFNSDYNAVGYDASAQLFAKGKGAMWIGGDWDSTIIKTGLGAGQCRRDADPAGARAASGPRSAASPARGTSRRRRSTPDLGAEWLNYVITSTQAKSLMFGQQQIPADKSAKPPTGDAYLTQVHGAFTKVANDDGLLLYTDWASPSMYTTLQNQFQLLLAGKHDPAGDGEGRAGRLGEVRQDAAASAS